MDTSITGSIILHLYAMAAVAQLVRAPDCDSGCRRFESGQPPHLKNGHAMCLFFVSHVTQGVDPQSCGFSRPTTSITHKIALSDFFSKYLTFLNKLLPTKHIFYPIIFSHAKKSFARTHATHNYYPCMMLQRRSLCRQSRQQALLSE